MKRVICLILLLALGLPALSVQAAPDAPAAQPRLVVFEIFTRYT
jgi:hypothetical protein